MGPDQPLTHREVKTAEEVINTASFVPNCAHETRDMAHALPNLMKAMQSRQIAELTTNTILANWPTLCQLKVAC